ncbi:heme biosynthesis protein HemY [Pseudoruegeria sp. SK021]|uniref:heme biosynthesis protein HemY n=1 Tax=Pseudoruegeria sp. SK021 TaxID=1933035 RepID=UPI000A2380FD|nr:heme biosynthesis HemY N-terminal domain-containing protein [Pseudoruegeria sp. SK021]OSP54607.1 heme biosynthesis protein HemY [Pseudoruegeria sp. SK021]
MLLSLLKILLFVAVVAGLIFGVEYLLENGEGLTIAIANTEFTLGPVQAVVAVILLLVVVWLFLKLLGLSLAVLHFVAGDETAITRYFARNRERRGFTALSDGIMALAAGEGKEAVIKANKAEKLLGRPELTNLIKAQAAEMAGDKNAATEAYKKLLDNEKTRFVGVRGLMQQKLDSGDTETALKLAEKAFVLRPRHADNSDMLLRLQAKNENWKGARKTLGAKLKYGNLPRDLHKRRDAVLALADARKRYAEGDLTAAHDEAIEADRLSPTLVPAAVLAAKAYVEMGKPNNAAKAIKVAWAADPHPDLAAAFAAIAPDETPTDRIKRFGALIGKNPVHPETRMLAAELELAAENFPGARKALGDLPTTDPSARALTLMAAIERGEGSDDSTVKAWLAKALTAPRGPQWLCENCGQPHGDWQAICIRCDGFDTLSWKQAPESDTMQGNSAFMLPLIVGREMAPNPVPDVDSDGVIDGAPVADVADETDPQRTAS